MTTFVFIIIVGVLAYASHIYRRGKRRVAAQDRKRSTTVAVPVQIRWPIWAKIVGVLLLISGISTIFNNRDNASTSHSDNSASSTAPEEKVKEPVYRLKDTVHVGYWSYAIWDIKWQRSLDSGYSNKQADAMFLVITVTARNEDNTSSTLPPFKLIDGEGREFDQSSDAALLPDGFGLLKNVNPGVSAQGQIVFDVPQGVYDLQVSGGFNSGKTTLVNLY